MHCFLRFFLAYTYFAFEIFLTVSSICFHVVCSNTGTTSDQLIDDWFCNDTDCDQFTKTNNFHPKFGGSFFEIKFLHNNIILNYLILIFLKYKEFFQISKSIPVLLAREFLTPVS